MYNQDDFKVVWHGCDWLTLTTGRTGEYEGDSYAVQARDMLSLFASGDDAHKIVEAGGPWFDGPVSFYPQGVRSEAVGVNVATRGGRSEGTVAQATGSAPAHVKARLWKGAVARPWVNVTRVDYAWDISSPEGYTVWDLYERFGLRWERGRDGEVRFMTSASGATIYVGSRRGQRFVRAYDRDVVLPDGSIADGIRVEIELKHGAAHALSGKYDNWPLPPLTGDLLHTWPELRETDVGRAIVRAGGEERTVPVPPTSADPEAWATNTVVPWLRKLARRDMKAARRVVFLLWEELGREAARQAEIAEGGEKA